VLLATTLVLLPEWRVREENPREIEGECQLPNMCNTYIYGRNHALVLIYILMRGERTDIQNVWEVKQVANASACACAHHFSWLV
jgi:hypothetical protein